MARTHDRVDGKQRSRFRARSLLFALMTMTLFTACASPAKRFDDTAASLGLRRQIVVGTEFQHVVFWRDGRHNRTLHVYLGGDGTPMSTGQPSEDPTPRNPLMLRLLSFDPGQAVYVGRPCYHGLTKAAGCSNELWTTARYSERVVASLAAAIRRIMTEQADRQLSLFGHSGGGTLAMLLAERFPETRALVTIAGNLDTDAWTAHHGFSPLTDSLNPITRPLLHRSLVQRHYVGERDRIVPSAIVKNAAAQLGTEAIVITGFDHVCCWEERWPQILADVTATE